VLAVFGRLARGVSLKRARAVPAVISRADARANPGLPDAKPFQPHFDLPLRDDLVRGIRPLLRLRFSASGFLLLIARTNNAGFLLARSASRSREPAVRADLGPAGSAWSGSY
jgi:hypothetical protein